MLLHVEQRGFQVRTVEFVRHTESNGAELLSLLNGRVEEAGSVGEGSPLFIRLDLLQEVLVDHGTVSTGQTSFHSLWWLHGDFNGHLEQR